MDHTEDGRWTEPDLSCHPVQRRFWLLAQAMAKLPLDEALVLAQEAEAFVVNGVDSAPEQAAISLCNRAKQDSLSEAAQEAGGKESAPPPSRKESPPRSVPGGSFDRQALFVRLAQGASNADLAKEFGLTQRQAQGFRMQMARPKAGEAATAPDEVIRFLRREGDVVVGAGDNQFIVNGRFRMTFEEITERANRIRARQGKQLFHGIGGTPVAILSALR